MSVGLRGHYTLGIVADHLSSRIRRSKLKALTVILELYRPEIFNVSSKNSANGVLLLNPLNIIRSQ